MNQAIRSHDAGLETDRIPWVPLAPGKSFKPLRFLDDNRGFVELLRLAPGERIPRHRHSGEVHACNVQGWREIDGGERVGPGGYVHEPAGNIDAWCAIGDEPLIVFVVVRGSVEYLDESGNVTQCWDAVRLREIYERYCADSGIPVRDLGRAA